MIHGGPGVTGKYWEQGFAPGSPPRMMIPVFHLGMVIPALEGDLRQDSLQEWRFQYSLQEWQFQHWMWRLLQDSLQEEDLAPGLPQGMVIPIFPPGMATPIFPPGMAIPAPPCAGVRSHSHPLSTHVPKISLTPPKTSPLVLPPHHSQHVNYRRGKFPCFVWKWKMPGCKNPAAGMDN